MEEKQQKRDQGGSIMENTMWGVHGVTEIVEKKSWRRNHGEGALNDIPRRRNQRRAHGEKLWINYAGEIMDERS